MNTSSDEPRTVPSVYPWAVVGMLWLICFFNYADRMAIFSVFPVLEKQFHFTKSQLGWIGAAFTWVYAGMAPFAGHVGDRGARKPVILGGLFAWSLITGFTAVCSRFWQFVLVRGLEGLGETFYFPASMALISDYHSPATRSRAIGLHQTSIYAGTIGGGALAGWMAEKHGWQSPFWVLAIAGVALGLVLGRAIREPGRNESERRLNPMAPEPVDVPLQTFLREFVHTPTAILLVMAYFGANMVSLIFLTWMPTFLKEKFGLTLAAAGFSATFFIQMASIAGSLLGGAMADRWAQQRIDGRIQVQALAILLGTPAVFVCGYTRTVWTVLAALTAFGLFKGMYDSNLTAAYYDVIAPARRSTATGLMNMIGWVAAGIGSVAIGVAVDHRVTMSTAIASTAVIYALVAGVLWSAGVFTAPRDIGAAHSIEACRELRPWEK